MGVTMEVRGSYDDAEKYLEKLANSDYLSQLRAYGEEGVEALKANTPVDTGLTADSLSYEIEMSDKVIAINWLNSNINKGVNIAVIIQYGHGTGTGGYVQGVDYINPAMQSVFDNIAESISREVAST